MLTKIYRLFHLDTFKKRMRFWFTGIILLFVLLSSLPFLIFAREFREEEAQHNIQQMIGLQQLVIEKWFDEKIASIRTISQLPAVRAVDKEHIKVVLETFDTNHTEFHGIVFVNKDGVSEIDTTGSPGVHLSDRFYFQEAKKGRSHVSDVLIGRQTKQAIIIFSSPVFDYQHQFQGLIFGSVRLDNINEVMKKFDSSETGQTYLVNREGLLLTEPRYPYQSIHQGGNIGFGAKINTEIYRLAIQGKPISESYLDYRGATVFGDYRWVNDQKWLIIGEIARDDVFAPFYRLMALLMVAFMVVFMTGLGISFGLSNQVERIFRQILEGSRQMGKGRYDHRIEPSCYAHHSHELRELCETFNGMAETIEYHMLELQQAQEKYRTVVENLKEVIFQTDTQGQWTYLNPAWEEITGYTVKESLGTFFLHYIHPDDRARNDQLFQSLIERKKEYCQQEIRYLKKEGGYCWIEVIARLTLDEQGQVLGASGTLNDINKRKEAEEELRASEELFRLLAEYSSDMITLHDANGSYLYISPACKAILQFDEEELVGQNSYLFIHPDDHENIQWHHKTLLETGYMVSTYRMRRKDGEYVWFESSIRLLHGIYSEDPKLIVVSRNINERKLAEQKLQEANQLLQRLSSIDGLTSVANRRAFDERLEMEWNRSCRSLMPLSLIMLDIDYFKAYNDTYGHQGGDGCLKQVAAVIQETLGRSTDLLCRYGGEEFAVILPETDEEGAKIVAEKIRLAIEGLKIPHAGSKIHDVVTISAGSATVIPNLYTSWMDLIADADKAVYQAKKDGRNCVRSYELA